MQWGRLLWPQCLTLRLIVQPIKLPVISNVARRQRYFPSQLARLLVAMAPLATRRRRQKNDAFRQLESVWDRWLRLSNFRRQSQAAEHTTGIDWRKANGTKDSDHPVWASVRHCVPIATEPNKYDPSVLLALNPVKVYESIISSGIAETEYGPCSGLPLAALSVMSGHTSNAASEGCHSAIAQLIMSESDLQTSMGDDILQMIVCHGLRDGKEAAVSLLSN
jgi:hypothetical protein